MKLAKKIFLGFVLLIFSLGAVLCLNPIINKKSIENMLSGKDPSLERVHAENNTCPNLLIKTGNQLFLQNTNIQQSESNPIVFENLDKYLEYVQAQRRMNVHCPVLFLQEESNTQGQNVYRMRPSPTSLEGGAQIGPIELVDGSRDHPPYNQNQFPGFDPQGYDVGRITELDIIHESTSKAPISDNPMDSNWGGTTFSSQAVASGKYAGSEVGKPTFVSKVF